MVGILRVFLLFYFFVLVACTKGELNDIPIDQKLSDDPQFALSDYTSTQATIHLTAQLKNANLIDADLLTLYSSANCSGAALTSLTVQSFRASGVTLTLPLLSQTQLTATLGSDTRCFLVGTYTPDVSSVAGPSFASSTPTSPSQATYKPIIKGSAFPSGALVEFFSDSACSISLGSGTGSHYQDPGLELTVYANTTTQIYAQAIDPLGTRSSCTHLFDYTHQSNVAPIAVFREAIPASPSNTVNPPVIRGSLDPSITSISIYSDSACQTLVVTKPSSDFTHSGFEVPIQANQTNQLYAVTTDTQSRLSPCSLLTTYEHDSVAPASPTFSSASPTSPTRLTTLPTLVGTASADTATVKFFLSPLCLAPTAIGSGTKASFESSGITANLPPNNTSAIYAQSFDRAGNSSPCTLLTSYRHNTIPPDPPTFSNTNPPSPTNITTTPLVLGTASDTTQSLAFYNDDQCTNLVGSGLPADFSSTGILVNLAANTLSNIYTRATDPEGNQSDCASLGTYAHSNLPAPPAAFTLAVPASPTRLTHRPMIVGSAPSTVSSVELYSDSICSTLLASGTRILFATAGLQVTLTQNAVNSIFAVSRDVYGNASPCTLLTSYTHANLPPDPPSLSSYSPLSPNNVSFEPVFRGQAYQNLGSPLPPNKIAFYDSEVCIGKLGEGSLANFQGGGIGITVPQNSVVPIYAKAFDAAFNSSACTYLLDYAYDSMVPASPIFLSANPASPSYTTKTIFSGTFGPHQDFLSRTSLDLFSDANCSSLLTTISPTLYESAGQSITVPSNQITSVYGQTVNLVGTRSNCTQLTNFRHYDLAPTQLLASARLDGTVQLNWFPDLISWPVPTYTVKRSLAATGPFSTIASGLYSPSYQDKTVNQAGTYYYLVMASNSTGKSQESAPVSITISAPAVPNIATLNAVASSAEVLLTWAGFGQHTFFKIHRATQPGGPYTEIVPEISASLYYDRSVVNNTTYYYVIEGLNPQGKSQLSNEARARPLPPPVAISSAWVQPLLNHPNCNGNAGVTILWTPSTYQDLYEILYGYPWGSTTTSLAGTATQPEIVACTIVNWGQVEWSIVSRWGQSGSVESPVAQFYNTTPPALRAHVGNSHFYLQWTPSPGPTSYSLYRSQSSMGPFVELANNLTGSTYTDLTVTNGQGYYYYLQGFIGSIPAGYPSAVVKGVPGPNPAAPTGLNLHFADGMVNLNWVGYAPYSRFLIYRASSSGGPYDYIGESTTTQYLDGAYQTGMNYYIVTAQWGNTETAPTGEASFRSGQSSTLTATGTASQINVSWSAVSGATSYRLERSTDELSGYVLVANQAATTYADTTAAAGQGYYYRVTPVFADATQGQPQLGSGMRTGAGLSPSGITIKSASESSVTLGWVTTPGASSYRVYRSTTVNGTYSQIGTTSSREYTAVALLSDRAYYFKVGAVISGVVNQSAAVVAYTYSTPMTPTAINGNNSLALEWSSVTSAVSYSLQRSSDGKNFSTIASGLTGLGYTDSTVSNYGLYFYKLTAHFASGITRQSDMSAGYSPGFSPNTPQGLHLQKNDDGAQIEIGWIPQSGASSYNVYTSLTPGGPYGSPVLTTPSTSKVVLSSLAADTPLYIKVSSLTGAIESGLSSELAVIPQLQPTAPTVQALADSTVQVTWSAVNLATTYDLLRSEDGYVFKTLASGLVGLTYNDASVSGGRTYFYKFQPRDGVKWLAESARSGRIFSVDIPVTPPEIHLEFTSALSVRVSWAPIPNVAGYEVFRSLTSGSGYTLLSTEGPTSFFYNDNTVSAGQTYYYVVRTLSASGRWSPYSPEKIAQLLTGPASLTASNQITHILLNWSSVGSAVNYQVYRSEKSGGPYGLVGTTASTTYSDTSAIANKTYYYIVTSTFASGGVGLSSPEASATKAGRLSFSHPIELIDRGILSSGSSDLSFERSLTPIDTQDFDGTVTYTIEITARNLDSSSRSVWLIDESNNVIGSIAIPANQTTTTRQESALSLSSGPHRYRIRLEQSSAANDIEIHSARIWVHQQNATKTRLYYPLFSSNLNSSSEDLLAPVYETNSEVAVIPDSAMAYRRQVTHLSRLPEFNAWTLYVLSSVTATNEGVFSLVNHQTGNSVGSSSTEVRATGVSESEIPIDEGAANFGTSQENNDYFLKALCSTPCTTGQFRIYKSFLSVKLENVSQLQVLIRTGAGQLPTGSSGQSANQISRLSLAGFTSPSVAFQSTLSCSSSAISSVSLATLGTSDLSTDPTTTLGPSSQSCSGTQTRQTSRSPSLVGMSADDRYLWTRQVTQGVVQIHGTSLVVEVGP